MSKFVSNTCFSTNWIGSDALLCLTLRYLNYFNSVFCVCVHVYGWACAMACMWRPEDNYQQSVLSFYHMGPWDWTWVIRFGSRSLYLMSPLSGHFLSFLRWTGLSSYRFEQRWESVSKKEEWEKFPSIYTAQCICCDIQTQKRWRTQSWKCLSKEQKKIVCDKSLHHASFLFMLWRNFCFLVACALCPTFLLSQCSCW